MRMTDHITRDQVRDHRRQRYQRQPRRYRAQMIETLAQRDLVERHLKHRD